MTTITDRAPATPFQRVLNVARLHLANPWTAVILPWMIMGFILIANIAIWWIIMANITDPGDRADTSEGLQYSGASTYIFVYMMVVAVQAISVTFPFALGYGVTRRDYYLGTALTFVGLSAMYSVGLAILAVIEEATGGWGVGGRMFTAIYWGEDWLTRLVAFFTTYLFFFFVGSVFAAVWVRWKANGLVAMFVGLGVVLIGGAALLTFTASWHVVGNFFAGAGFLGSYLWSLVLTAIAAIAGFFVLRRATPRN